MRKPPPFVLPLSCGLFLWMFIPIVAPASPLSSQAALINPSPPTDTPALQVNLVSTLPNGAVTISISNHTKIYTNIRFEWQVLVNGIPGQKGLLPDIALAPTHPRTLHLTMKPLSGNDEAWLRVICRPALHAPPSPNHPTASHSLSAGNRMAAANRPPAGPPVLLEQLLPLQPWRGDYAIPGTGDLTFVDSNGIFTISSPNTLIQFDKQTGWLLHYEAGHILLMGDTAGVQPTLWPGIPPRLQLFSTSTGPQLAIVRTEYTLPETASLLHMSYTINASGAMLVGLILEPDTTRQIPDTVKLPPLPDFGMNWLLPAGLDTLTWFGASPPAIFDTALAPSTGPRETGCSAVRWLTITGDQGAGLRITADSTLINATLSPFDDTVTHTKRMLLNIGSHASSDTAQRVNRQYVYKVTPALFAKPI